MRSPSPFIAIGRSSTFRLTLLYFLLFAVSVFALFALAYWQTVILLERQSTERLSEEIDDLATIYRTGGPAELVRAIVERSDASRGTSTLYLLADPNGRPLAGNLDGWPTARATPEGWIEFQIRDRLGGGSRPGSPGQPSPAALTVSAEAKTFMLPGGIQLLVGRNLADLQAYQRRFGNAATLIAVLTILLGLGGGLLVTRRVLARLETINGISDRILAGDLGRRIPVGARQDEFDRLAGNLNAMLDEIERLLAGMRQVTDNIAHDLRTPLGRLRTRLELTLRQPREGMRDEAALQGGIVEIDNLLETFNALLLIAEAEAGHREATFVPVDLATTVRDVVELYTPAAEEQGLQLAVGGIGSAWAMGEPHLLAQLVANLIDNAVKFSRSGGRITVTWTAGADLVSLDVSDEGSGIPVEDRGRVFDRLVRLDRSRGTAGSGLGLSLVRAVVDLHRGRIRLEDNDPGLRVVVELPSAPTKLLARGAPSAGSPQPI